MAIQRRISATFKDLPGGQILGPTYDYTHRLLDFRLAGEGGTRGRRTPRRRRNASRRPKSPYRASWIFWAAKA